MLEFVDENITSIQWTRKQNDIDNSMLPNVYNIRSGKELIDILDEKGVFGNDRKYLIQRWLKVRNARMDENMFCLCRNVRKNQNSKGDWDFELDGVKVDLKSTRFPQYLIDKGERIEDYISSKEKTVELIRYFYNNQTKNSEGSIREKYNSRLFLVHHSNFGEDRTHYLESYFKGKMPIIRWFCDSICELGWCQWSEDENSLSQVIYIVETEQGKLHFEYSDFIKFN